MAKSLLAHLYTHIKGSQEDVATLSLQYILSSSEEISRAFNLFVSERLNRKVPEKLQYICQSVGNNQERPDMAGVDLHGNEKILFEMKFYAALTENQPLTYLRRLKDENGIGLMIICPQARVTSLWTKIKEICNSCDICEIDSSCIEVNGISMSIVSWNEVIDIIRRTAINSCPEIVSDIIQLDGYCSQMDSEAFIPFKSEDLGADVARREERYYRVIDELIDNLCNDDAILTSLKGLKATPQKFGYTRYIYLNNFGVNISYNRNYWMDVNTVDTPFWIKFGDEKFKMHKDINKKLQGIQQQYRCEDGKEIAMALIPLSNSTLAEVVDDMKKQITAYLSFIKNDILRD